ncbi:conserved hypothetical protein, secreted [Candidatus Magnetomorum sp. HK-1]|nr:conserved hypothetical protein, secreted [Candidatus Magnetomorum sp. HK-1]
MSIKNENAQLKPSLAKKLSAYSTIACTSLLTSSPASAGVIYKNVADTRTTDSYDVYFFSTVTPEIVIDKNGQNIDITGALDVIGNNVKTGIGMTMSMIGSMPMSVPISYFKKAATPVSNSYVISSSNANWGLQDKKKGIILDATGSYNSNAIGQFTRGTPGFLGVKFKIGQNIHYGWIRLTIDADASAFTVHDHAYNDAPGESITITLPSPNTAPVLSNFDTTLQVQNDGTPIVLDSDVTVSDTELDNANSFEGAKIAISRDGLPDSNDVFSNSGRLGTLTEGNSFTLNGEQLGTVESISDGYFELKFNANATSAKVDEVLQSITYSNSNETTGSQIVLNFGFNDGNLNDVTGNIGDQGYGNGTVSMLTTLHFVSANEKTSNPYSIPTMNEYGMIILAMILMGSAARMMPKQNEEV